MKTPIHPKARAIIFDLDGTLVNSMPLHYKACQIVCNENGFDFPLDFFYEKAGIPTHKVFEMLGKKLQIPGINWYELGSKKEEKFIEIIDEVQPFPLAKEIVLSCYKKMPLAIGSGSMRETVMLSLEVTGLKEYFDVIVSSDDIIKPKPDPETFLTCATKMNVAPEYCQVFEDGEMGLIAAKSAHMIATDIRPYFNN